MSLFRNGYILSLPGFGKLSTIVMGIIVMIVGLRSHYQSAWVESKYYKVCEIYILHHAYQEPCPNIGMERYYVAVIILCFILSIAGMILSVSLVNPYSTVFWIFTLATTYLRHYFYSWQLYYILCRLYKLIIIHYRTLVGFPYPLGS
ncbi:unnamed protein product [Orchesella dallaii]|uniref:Uncharacterized protein n=1 Tax=Orchesella dallaii TaxID=48710 RepID=A0ABP1S2W6_9HEXA